MSRLSEAAAAFSTRLAYWLMDESSGTTIDDSESTNDLTSVGATVNQASIVPSNPNGKSISFDGVNDYLRVDLPAAYKVNVLEGMFVLRVPDPWPAAGGFVIALQPRGSFGGKGILLFFQSDGAGRRLGLQKGTGAAFITLTGGSSLSDDTTYMVFFRAGTTGMQMWAKTVVGGPGDTAVATENQNSNTTATDWTDAAAGNYPDPAQMFVGAAKANALGGGATVPETSPAKMLLSDLALFDGTTTELSDANRSTLYAAACFSRPPGAFTSPLSGQHNIANAISLAWAASAGESGFGTTYEIEYERNNTGTRVDIATQSGTSYSFTAPTPGMYKFYVRSIIDSVPSEWVESDEITILRQPGGTPRTHSEVVDGSSPEDRFSMEETTSGADFITALSSGYNAVGGVVNPSSSAADFESRSEDGICNAVRTKSGDLAANWLTTRRPNSPGLYTNRFATAVWAKPLVAESGGPPLMLLKPLHANTNEITGGLSNDFVAENGMYGLGYSFTKDRIAVFLYSHNYFNDVTEYLPSSNLSEDWHRIAVTVDIYDDGGTFKLRIKLRLNGEYCDDLSGTYTELDHTFNVEGAPISGHVGADKLSWVASWPVYGSDFDLADTFGNRFNGYFDEPVFWAWPNDDDDYWLADYLSGLATINANPVGAINVLEDEYPAGTALALSWGTATGATGYLIERSIDGAAYAERATSVTASYVDTLPATEHDEIRYRISPMFNGYAPEECAVMYALSSTFATISSGEPPQPASDSAPCPPDVISPTTIARLETWTDSPFNGGTRTGFIPDFLTVNDHRVLGGEESVGIVIPRMSAKNEAAGVWARLTPNTVIRTVYRWRRDSVYRRQQWEEWRMVGIKDGRDERDATIAELACDAMHYDLRRVMMRRTEANGLVQMQYGDYGRSPATHVDAILDRVDEVLPGMFSRGIIMPTDLADIDYDWDNARSALGKLEAACVGYELFFGRNCEGYLIHIVEEAPTLPDITAAFTYSVVSGTTVQFLTTGSTAPGADLVSWHWDFGDNSTGFGNAPTHAYSGAGTYSVTLTIYDHIGRSDSYTANVTV